MDHLLVVAFVVGLELTTGPVGLLFGSGVLLAYLMLVAGATGAARTTARPPLAAVDWLAALHDDLPGGPARSRGGEGG